MNKKEEIEIELNILKYFQDITKPNFEKDIIEIDLGRLDNKIKKLEAQLEILQEEQPKILELNEILVCKEKEIEEYKAILKKVVEGEDIHNAATPNQLRKIYNLKTTGNNITK